MHLWYLLRMPEMDAPRALVFKGNEALGNEIANKHKFISYSTQINLKINLRNISEINQFANQCQVHIIGRSN